MAKQLRIGIIFCDPPSGHVPVDLSELISYARKTLKIPVIIPQSRYLFSDYKVLYETLRHHQLEKLILAGISLHRFKSMVTRVMVDLGKTPESVFLAEFPQEWNILDESMSLLIGQLSQIHSVINKREKIPVVTEPNTLVIGAGIAGIQAALEIANAGVKVYLLEKTGTIGGHMAKFDKTFPTLDCAACILTPKMVEVGQHPKIELLTYSEVVSVEGEPGNFSVEILKHARRVNEKTCIGCGTCAEKCPSQTKSEFDEGTTMRKAIYISFPQAVPNKYLIDANECRYVKDGKCRVCVKVCPVPDCIDLDQKDEKVNLKVGNIIMATGFKGFDASRVERFGYGRFPNVLTSLEFERLINAAGPTGGNITLRNQDKKGNWIFDKDHAVPASVGIIHCVGSRDENFNSYCSKVCCMYSLKLAHLVKEKLPNAPVFEYFIDMRAFGKGYEEFYNRILDEGIHLIRGRTATVTEEQGVLLLRSEDMIHGRILEQNLDMIILSVGLEPVEEQQQLSKITGIGTDSSGWFTEQQGIMDPVSSTRPGIHLAGVCQGPKDIPDTVVQASAAAAAVLRSIRTGASESKASLPQLDTINQPL